MNEQQLNVKNTFLKIPDGRVGNALGDCANLQFFFEILFQNNLVGDQEIHGNYQIVMIVIFLWNGSVRSSTPLTHTDNAQTTALLRYEHKQMFVDRKFIFDSFSITSAEESSRCGALRFNFSVLVERDAKSI